MVCKFLNLFDVFFFFFFFSSRRRHTRCSRDWSSDVCSSDLAEIRGEANNWTGLNQGGFSDPAMDRLYAQYSKELEPGARNSLFAGFLKQVRSEERRVGKEWRTRWWLE